MSDKRINIRFEYHADVEIEFNSGASQTATVVNMSSGGVLLTTDPLPKFGEKVTLKMDLPGIPNVCTIPCIVRWIKQGEGAGLQFERLRPIEMWAINRLKRNQPESKD